MSFHNSFHNSQTNTSSIVFIGTVKALEYFKYPVSLLGVNTNTVVGHFKDPIIILFFCRDVYSGTGLGIVFNGVTDEILEELNHLGVISSDHR